MQRTYKERLEAGLQALGWQADTTGSGKYSAWRKAGMKSKAFVGSNGALRLGECASRSFSVGDATRQKGFYAEVLAKGDATFPKEGSELFKGF